MNLVTARGSVLLAVLFFTLIASISAIYCERTVRTIINSLQDEAHASIARAHSDFEALEQALVQLSNDERTRNDCLTTQFSAGRNKITRHACLRLSGRGDATAIGGLFIGARNPTIPFPILDYDRLFESTEACSMSTLRRIEATSSGRPITEGSSISSKVCRNPPATEFGYLAPVNLEITNIIAFGDAGEVARIAAPGYVEITSSITASSELLIIAGGDLSIHELLLPNPDAHATLFSASGSVILESIQGAGSLTVYAWYDATLPPGARLVEQTIDPGLLLHEVKSITAGDAGIHGE